MPSHAGWRFAWKSPAAMALYGLLEQLGYPVSDTERARLTPPDDERRDGGEQRG